MKVQTQRFSHHISVPSDEGVRVDKTITIQRPPAQVYAFWRRLENLPCFMRHVESVTVDDDLHSHWEVRTVAGKTLEWDAEIIEQRENEMISWRSIPGADVDNAGSVWFTPEQGGQATVVKVSLKYVPPAGRAGAMFAKLFHRDADAEIEDDLNCLKSLLETGRLPADGMMSAWRERAVQAAKAADEYVRASPWRAIATVAISCFTLGCVMGWSALSNRRGRQLWRFLGKKR